VESLVKAKPDKAVRPPNASHVYNATAQVVNNASNPWKFFLNGNQASTDYEHRVSRRSALGAKLAPKAPTRNNRAAKIAQEYPLRTTFTVKCAQ
jgi:hypothetical protein